MGDLRFNNDYCIVVVNDTDEVLINEKLTGRVETMQHMEKHTEAGSLPIDLLPVIPNVGEWCEIYKCYKYGDKIAECYQSHNRMHFALEDTPALWGVHEQYVDYPIWKQPTGAHDAYQKGDRVHFPIADSPVYESKINANVWSPTAYPAGWLLIS